jgi:hypothetical protein
MIYIHHKIQYFILQYINFKLGSTHQEKHSYYFLTGIAASRYWKILYDKDYYRLFNQ